MSLNKLLRIAMLIDLSDHVQEWAAGRSTTADRGRVLNLRT